MHSIALFAMMMPVIQISVMLHDIALQALDLPLKYVSK